jgi:hypothetical protein
LVVRELNRRLWGVGTLGLLIAGSAAGYTALTTRDAGVLESDFGNDSVGNTLVVEAVATNRVQSLLNEYTSQGGTEWDRFRLPARDQPVLRVTDRRWANCAREHPDAMTCFDLVPNAPMSIVAVSSNPRQEEPRLAPVFSEDVSIVEISDQGTVISVFDLRGRIDPSLQAENLPGAVLPLSLLESVGHEIGLSGLERLAFHDFGRLSRARQGEFRFAVERYAPASLMTDPSAGVLNQDQERQVAALVALAAGTLSMLAVAVGALGAVAALQGARQQLAALGYSAVSRVGIALEAVSPLIGGIAVVAIGVSRTVTIAGVAGDASPGWTWGVPLGMAFIALVAMPGAFVRVPRRRLK